MAIFNITSRGNARASFCLLTALCIPHTPKDPITPISSTILNPLLPSEDGGAIPGSGQLNVILSAREKVDSAYREWTTRNDPRLSSNALQKLIYVYARTQELPSNPEERKALAKELKEYVCDPKSRFENKDLDFVCKALHTPDSARDEALELEAQRALNLATGSLTTSGTLLGLSRVPPVQVLGLLTQGLAVYLSDQYADKQIQEVYDKRLAALATTSLAIVASKVGENEVCNTLLNDADVCKALNIPTDRTPTQAEKEVEDQTKGALDGSIPALQAQENILKILNSRLQSQKETMAELLAMLKQNKRDEALEKAKREELADTVREIEGATTIAYFAAKHIFKSSSLADQALKVGKIVSGAYTLIDGIKTAKDILSFATLGGALQLLDLGLSLLNKDAGQQNTNLIILSALDNINMLLSEMRTEMHQRFDRLEEQLKQIEAGIQSILKAAQITQEMIEKVQQDVRFGRKYQEEADVTNAHGMLNRFQVTVTGLIIRESFRKAGNAADIIPTREMDLLAAAGLIIELNEYANSTAATPAFYKGPRTYRFSDCLDDGTSVENMFGFAASYSDHYKLSEDQKKHLKCNPTEWASAVGLILDLLSTFPELCRQDPAIPPQLAQLRKIGRSINESITRIASNENIRSVADQAKNELEVKIKSDLTKSTEEFEKKRCAKEKFGRLTGYEKDRAGSGFRLWLGPYGTPWYIHNDRPTSFASGVYSPTGNFNLRDAQGMYWFVRDQVRAGRNMDGGVLPAIEGDGYVGVSNDPLTIGRIIGLFVLNPEDGKRDASSNRATRVYSDHNGSKTETQIEGFKSYEIFFTNTRGKKLGDLNGDRCLRQVVDLRERDVLEWAEPGTKDSLRERYATKFTDWRHIMGNNTPDIWYWPPGAPGAESTEQLLKILGNEIAQYHDNTLRPEWLGTLKDNSDIEYGTYFEPLILALALKNWLLSGNGKSAVEIAASCIDTAQADWLREVADNAILNSMQAANGRAKIVDSTPLADGISAIATSELAEAANNITILVTMLDKELAVRTQKGYTTYFHDVLARLNHFTEKNGIK